MCGVIEITGVLEILVTKIPFSSFLDLTYLGLDFGLGLGLGLGLVNNKVKLAFTCCTHNQQNAAPSNLQSVMQPLINSTEL